MYYALESILESSFSFLTKPSYTIVLFLYLAWLPDSRWLLCNGIVSNHNSSIASFPHIIIITKLEPKIFIFI